MNNYYRIIAIMGKSGSGKDTILNILYQQYDTHKIISCTTRPLRQGEKDGIDYYYLTNEAFAEKIMNGDMLEAKVFNTWAYGTSKASLNPNKWNIGVFSPESVEDLLGNKYIDLRIFYIYAPDKIRIIRQLNREINPDVKEIVRRFSTDEADFQYLGNYFPYVKLDNIDLGDQFRCVEDIAESCGLDRLN